MVRKIVACARLALGPLLIAMVLLNVATATLLGAVSGSRAAATVSASPPA